jgi:hypothetical protein
VDVYGDPFVGIPMDQKGVNPSGDAASRHPSLDYSQLYQTSGDGG